MTNTSPFARVALNTRESYSFARYGEAAWNAAAAEIVKIVGDEKTAEAIMMSRHMRYAADMYAASDSEITGLEIVRFIAMNPRHFTAKALADLVANA